MVKRPLYGFGLEVPWARHSRSGWRGAAPNPGTWMALTAQVSTGHTNPITFWILLLLLTLMHLSGCTNSFPSLGRLAVLNSWFGYISNNPFITHAFYIVRDRSYWQRRETHKPLDSSWAPWHSFAMAILHIRQRFFVSLLRLQFPANCPSTLSTYWKRKERQRNLYTGSPSVRSPWCMGLKPQSKPRTPEGAGLSPPPRAYPRSGQAQPPSTLLAVAIKSVAPNEISRPKMHSHMGTAIQWGFNYPRAHAGKILIW